MSADPLALDYAPPTKAGRVWLLRAGLIAAMSVAVLGTIAVFVDLESGLFSGPILLLIGLYLLIAGVMRRMLWLAVTGTLHVGICALLFGFVRLLHWSPNESETPFRVLSTIYCWPRWF